MAQLRQQVSRLDQAITAWTAAKWLLAVAVHRRPSSPHKQLTVALAHMSAAARAKIAAAQRARWAKQKGAGCPQESVPRRKPTGRKPMSPAMRKKLSAMMKARWAARKKGT